MKYAVKTDIGRRLHNEDNFLLPEPGAQPQLFAVADGMGGHAAGAVASRLLVERLGEHAPFENGREIEQLLSLIGHANLSVYEASESDRSLRGMGTTLVLALVLGERFLAANIGDSRMYYYNGVSLARVTTDHSYVEQLVLSGAISREAARYHPQRNIITRAVGLSPAVDTDLFEREWNPGDMLLLCSDGLHGAVEEDEILSILQSTDSPEEICERLVFAALENDGTDNITLIVVLCEEGDVE